MPYVDLKWSLLARDDAAVWINREHSSARRPVGPMESLENDFPRKRHLLGILTRFCGYHDLVGSAEARDNPTAARRDELSTAITRAACHGPASADGRCNRGPLRARRGHAPRSVSGHRDDGQFVEIHGLCRDRYRQEEG